MADEQDVLEAAIEQVNAAGEGEGTEPDEETTSTEEGAATSEGDVKAAEEESEESDSEVKPAKKVFNERLQKILDKYGGDEDKLVDAIYHQWNSSSEMYQHLRGLEARVAELSKVAEKPPEPSEDAKALQEEIAAVDEEAKGNRQEMDALLGKMDKLNKDIYKLQGRIEATDDEDVKARLESREGSLKAELANIVRDYRDHDKTLKRLDKERRALNKSVKDAEKEAETTRAEEMEIRAEEARIQADAYRDYMATVEDYQSRYAFPNPLRVAEAVKQELVAYINSLPPDHGLIDIKAKASSIYDEWVSEFKLVERKKFSDMSKQKAALESKKPPPEKDKPARKSTDDVPEYRRPQSYWTEQADKARAAARR